MKKAIDTAEIVRLRTEGKTLRQIGETLGVSASTVADHLAKSDHVGAPKSYHRSRIVIDREKVEQALSFHRGLSRAAASLGIGVSTLQRLITQHGLDPVDPRRIDFDIATIEQALEANGTLPRAAKALGVSRRTLRTIMERNGWSRRYRCEELPTEATIREAATKVTSNDALAAKLGISTSCLYVLARRYGMGAPSALIKGTKATAPETGKTVKYLLEVTVVDGAITGVTWA